MRGGGQRSLGKRGSDINFFNLLMDSNGLFPPRLLSIPSAQRRRPPDPKKADLDGLRSLRHFVRQINGQGPIPPTPTTTQKSLDAYISEEVSLVKTLNLSYKTA